MPQDQSLALGRDRQSKRYIEKDNLGRDDRAPDDLAFPGAIASLPLHEMGRSRIACCGDCCRNAQC
jgi:hypothetical protein